MRTALSFSNKTASYGHNLLGTLTPLPIGEKSPLQCAGLNRHEAENAKFLRVRISDPLGSEFCAGVP